MLATRHDALTEMPPDLTEDERWAYIRGYARGCHTWVKKNGVPTVDGPVLTPEAREDLHRRTRQMEQDRHPFAHKAGVRELRKYWTKYPRQQERAA